MTFAEFVKNLRTLKIKKKGMRPKVNPNKFYPYQADLQTEEALREELKDYANRLEIAAGNGGVQAVYAVPGAVPEDFEPKVRNLAELVSEFQMRIFANFSEMAVGEKFFPNQDGKDEILSVWTSNFVNLCKSTNEEMRKKVAGVVSDGVLAGRSTKDIARDIQNTCSDFTRNKAELIATTEVSKLNSAIAKNQSESAGIKFYEWAAAMDGRTRESHAVMDGKICKWGEDDFYYKWSDPDPKTGKRKLVRVERPSNAYSGAPGTDFRCRCVALPYIPEFEDDYEEEREKSTQRGVVQTQEHPEPMSQEQIAFLNQINESRITAGKSRKPGNRAAYLLRKREQADYELEMARDYEYLAKRPLDVELNTFYKLWCRKDGSEKLNDYLLEKNLLNKKSEDHPRFDEREERMNAYIAENPLKRNMTLWRCMSLASDVLDNYKKKKSIFCPGIVSFSKSMQHAASYYDPNIPKGQISFLIKLDAKKDDKVAPPYQIKNGRMVGYAEECEFNAPSKSKLRIKKERFIGEVIIFECTLEA